MNDDEIQLAVLRRMYEFFEDSTSTIANMEAVAHDLAETRDLTVNEVQYAMKRLGDDGFIRPPKGSQNVLRQGQISPEGMDRLEDLTGETFLYTTDDKRLEILSLLDNMERQSPSAPAFRSDALIDNIQADLPTLERNVWYMDKAYWVDADYAMNTGANSLSFIHISLTRSGRSVYETSNT